MTYLAEFIQRADAPLAVGLNAHDLMQSHDMGCSAGPKACGWMPNSAVLSAGRPQSYRRNYARVLKDCRELCIVKLSVGSTLQAMREHVY
jgi:hypothetical protein